MRIAILLTALMCAFSFGQQTKRLSPLPEQLRGETIPNFFALAIAAYGQKQRLAVLPSVGELEPKKLELLTDKVREIASKTLPSDNFILLRQDAVVEAIGAEEYFVACKEGTCIGELAKKANANYGARCDVFKVDNNLVLKFELYSVKDEAILETFTDYEAKDFYGMLAVLEKRLPGAFRKMIPGSSKPIPQAFVPSGMDNEKVETKAASKPALEPKGEYEKQSEFDARSKKMVCDAETANEKTLLEKCRKMGRSAAGYRKCIEDFRNRRDKVEQACREDKPR